MLEILSQFPPVSLSRLDSVTLMNRTDTKFVTSMAKLDGLLSLALENGYSVLEVDGSRASAYDSLYFDTPDLKMYTEHHNGHLFRQKVRTRTYLESGATFLEVKRKNNHKRTKKKRVPIPRECFEDFSSCGDAASFLVKHSSYNVGDLRPRLNTRFTRITLVDPDFSERLTIDMNLTFHNHTTGLSADLGDAVIIELKQDSLRPSRMRGIFLSLRIKPLSVSKYCTGNVLTDPSIKGNRFKIKIRQLKKISSC